MHIKEDGWQCFSTTDKNGVEYEVYVKGSAVVVTYYGNQLHNALSSLDDNPDNRIPGVFDKAVKGIHDNDRETFNQMLNSLNIHWQIIIGDILE